VVLEVAVSVLTESFIASHRTLARW
jgi:hypothetical protein